MSQRFTKPVTEARHTSRYWDGVIGIILFLLAVLHFESHHAGMDWLSLCALAAFLVIVYGSFIEPRLITVRRYEIGGGTRVLKLAYLSDIHVGPYKGRRWLARLSKAVNALGPDVILLGGDYLFDDPEQAPLLDGLKALKAPLGVYGILGNHDGLFGIKETVAQFEAMKIPILRNQAVPLPAAGIDVVGVNDDWYDETDFDAAERGVRPGEPSIMLIHNPDLAPIAAKYKPTLMLAGHTHGGQIRLPFIGPVPRLPHWLGRKYDRGQFAFDGVPLIIGQGVGESGPRARLFCPPQIVFVTLRY